VPLVTLIGDTFASRVAASLLCAAGLPELVAHSWDGYFSLARSLATDPQRLSALRARLSEAPAKLPLFDTRRFTHNLERVYGRMWEQAQRGEREIIVLEDGSPR
jgi:protein O-GlcNAc transferase